MLRSADDAQLAHRHRDGDAAGRDALISRHLPFARALARRYRTAGEPMEDLYQVATVGLLKAVDRWDPGHGSSFRAFATPTVLGEIRRHFRDTTWTVRPPRALQELTLSLERARSAWQAHNGRPPTTAQLAVQLGRDPADVEEALQATLSRVPEPLHAMLDGEGPRARHHAAAVGRVERGYEAVEAAAAAERLLGTLDRRSRVILRLRFEEDLSQAEIALRVGLSQTHVGRIIAGSLDRLHRLSGEHGVAAAA